MVKLVTLLNGVSAALFHVEHLPGQTWRYRWRITSPCPAAYAAWREGAATGPRVVFQPEIAGCEVAAEWRDAPGEPWRQAALHRTAPGKLPVRILALMPVAFTEPVEMLAAVDDRVAAYRVPPFALAAGEAFDTYADAIGPFADNVLLAGEPFLPVDSRLRVTGSGPSRGSFVADPGPARLAIAPGAPARRLFAFAPLPNPEPQP